MPLLHLKKRWTPLELFGIELYQSEEGEWFIKRRKRPIRRLF
jgi:hypothetical protein